MNANILNNNHPTWIDAAKIALILTAGLLATMFLPNWTYEAFSGDIERFLFEAVKFSFTGFITTFISLTGLAYATKPKVKNSDAEN